MKKGLAFIFVVAVFVMLSGTAFSAPLNQKNTGCGLGTMVFEGKNGLASQTCAVTTNGTFGNQTFGITSGTSNCDKPSSYSSNQKLQEFVAGNMGNLAQDMARGNGEYLNTLAVLIGVPEGQRADFYSYLQSNFSRIYTSEKVTSTDVLNNLEALTVYPI
ncbi:MAG: hypothetical protein A4E72_02097 [Syntrophus sp. PtaU1.Bin208]|nr:MAG: hypothetical protein A4E72_02097 [Syntrophus sp. PtaU1.Bin208]